MMVFLVLSNLQVCTMEWGKHRRCIQNEATPVSDSSSTSDDDNSAFKALEEGRDNSPNSPSVSLGAEVVAAVEMWSCLSCDQRSYMTRVAIGKLI